MLTCFDSRRALLCLCACVELFGSHTKLELLAETKSILYFLLELSFTTHDFIQSVQNITHTQTKKRNLLKYLSFSYLNHNELQMYICHFVSKCRWWVGYFRFNLWALLTFPNNKVYNFGFHVFSLCCSWQNGFRYFINFYVIILKPHLPSRQRRCVSVPWIITLSAESTGSRMATNVNWNARK